MQKNAHEIIDEGIRTQGHKDSKDWRVRSVIVKQKRIHIAAVVVDDTIICTQNDEDHKLFDWQLKD